MKRKILLPFVMVLFTMNLTNAQTYRYLKVLTLKCSNHKWQELEWFSEGTAYPQPKLTSANSNGMTVFGDSGGNELWWPYDGDPDTHAWIGEINPPLTHSITLDLGAGNGIRPDSLRITKPSYSLVYDFQVWASNDATDWQLLLDARDLSSNDHAQMTFPLNEIPDTIAPSTPQNLALNTAKLTSLSISWDPSTDDREVGYYVVYLNDIPADSTSGTGILITSLDTATVYQCYVVAVDKAGNRSDKSETLAFSTKQVDNEAPSDPGDPVLADRGYDMVKFRWAASSDNDELSGYLVYMNDQIVGTPADTVFAVPGLDPGTAYDFKIFARDISGNLSAYSSGTFSTTTDVPEKMLIGTNFWNIGWGGSSNDPFKDGYQSVTGENPWKQAFLDDVSFYSHYRFMDWLVTNNSNLSQWMDRKQKVDPNQRPMAFEWMIDLCNRQHRDMWVTLPHKIVSRSGMEGGSNHFALKFAILVKTGVDMTDIDLDQEAFSNLAEMTAADLVALGGLKTCEPLDPGLKLYVEYSNETWNFGFSQAEYCRQEGVALGLPGDEYAAGREFHSWAALKIFKAMEDVFGPGSTRIMKIDAYQAVVPSQINDHLKIYESTEYNPGGIFPDAFAPAPYFGNGVNGADPDMKDQLVSSIKQRTDDVRFARRNLDNGTKRGDPEFKLIAYEGGQHMLTNADVGCRNEVMYELYVQYLDSMNHYLDEMSHYVHSGSFGSGGAWGAKEYIGQPLEEAHKFRGIYEWVNGTATRPDTEKPTIPSDLSVSGKGETSFILNWTASTDNDAVASYIVYLDGEIYSEVSGAPATIGDLLPGRTYRVTVAAVDASGNISGPSQYLDVTTTGTASFTVTFIVDDGTNALAGADVLFNGLDAVTGADGSAVFTGQPAGTDLPYQVSLDNYEPASGTVSLVNTDPVIQISLDQQTGVDPQDVVRVRLFPNPVSDVLTMESGLPLVSVVVTDISGRVVRKVEAATGVYRLNISGLDDGLYLVQTKLAGGNSLVQKVIVKKRY